MLLLIMNQEELSQLIYLLPCSALNIEMQIGESKESIIASITANLFNSVESDIRFKLIKIVNNLSDEQLETFRDIAKQLLEESDNQGE